MPDTRIRSTVVRASRTAMRSRNDCSRTGRTVGRPHLVFRPATAIDEARHSGWRRAIRADGQRSNGARSPLGRQRKGRLPDPRLGQQ